MSKVRVHELAKDLDINSKELIALLTEYGFSAKNHMSTLETEELDIIFEVYTQKFDKKVEIPVFGKNVAPKEEPKQEKKADKKEEKEKPQKADNKPKKTEKPSQETEEAEEIPVKDLFKQNEGTALTLLSIHNIQFLLNLVKQARIAILNDSYADFYDCVYKNLK